MTIQSQDIRILRSQVMADVPEGGGGPTNQAITYGQSNTMFDDVSTIARVQGNVSIRVGHVHVDTPTVDRLLGPYAMVSTLPIDPNVSVVLAECATFARRSQLAQSIAAYLIPAVPWNGFLLANHVANQESIEICQRPGTTLPPVGKTLVLVLNEGQPNEVKEYVRVLEISSEIRIATDNVGDYPYLSVRCAISPKLGRDWPGTDPNRAFTTGSGKAKLRDTTVANASHYYGASALTSAYTMASGDKTLKVDTVFGQLVPSSASDSPMSDRRPASQRLVTLATTPRSIQVTGAPHTMRIRVTAESRTNAVSRTLRPMPEPGTVTVTYVALGNRQTLTDTGVLDGTVVRFEGAGNGTLNPTTGTLNLTLDAQPDVGTFVLITWGERLPYTNRTAMGAQVRAPEYVIPLAGDGAAIAESIVIKFPSESVIRTATVSSTGVISGDATGVVDAVGKKAFIRPTYMVDPGGEFEIEYQLDTVVTDILDAPAVDGAGTGLLTLTQTPVAGTVQVTWATEQETTVASGQYVQRLETVVEQNTEIVVEAVEEAPFQVRLQDLFPVGPASSWSNATNWPRHA